MGNIYFLDNSGFRVVGENMTFDWLAEQGKQYLVEAVLMGKFGADTAFESALDNRPLSQRVADWDARRQSLISLGGK